MNRLRDVKGLIDVKIIKGEDGKDDLIINVNEDLILKEGVQAINDILMKI